MDKAVSPSRTTKEEEHKLPTHEEAGLEKSSKSLNEKLASILLDCHDGDNPPTKHSQKSQEGIPGNLIAFLRMLISFFSTFNLVLAVPLFLQ